MSATLLLGQPIADQVYASVSKGVQKLNRLGRRVHICAVLVGEDPGSIAYLRIKEARCKSLGIDFTLRTLAANTAYEQLEALILELNNDRNITGIIVQLPLPDHLDRDRILQLVRSLKDIDAFFYSLSRTATITGVPPPTPHGMLKLLDYYHLEMQNKNVVVVGHGLLVGQPLAQMIKERGIHPAVIEEDAHGDQALLQSADIIMTGVGHPNLIQPGMIKEGVVIVDAGYEKVNGRVYGDVSAECAEKALAMTPSVGGVGPLTVACLLENALKLAQMQQSKHR